MHGLTTIHKLNKEADDEARRIMEAHGYETYDWVRCAPQWVKPIRVEDAYTPTQNEGEQNVS